MQMAYTEDEVKRLKANIQAAQGSAA